MKKVYSAAKARKDFANIINMVAFMGNSVIIERYGEPVVKIIPAKREEDRSIAKLVERHFGIWAGEDWAKDIGKPSRYFRKRPLR